MVEQSVKTLKITKIVQDPVNTGGGNSNTLCKHYNKGRCKHGFSGQKRDPESGVERCGWKHPKVCEKLFKYGHDRERGCLGKRVGCTDYHPYICGKSFKEKCDENCKDGFHLRSIMRRHKKVPPTRDSGTPPSDGERKDDSSNQNPGGQVVEVVGTQVVTPAAPVLPKEDTISKTFLEEIMASLKEIKERQNKQDEQMMRLVQSNQPQPQPQGYQIPQELMMKLLLK